MNSIDFWEHLPVELWCEILKFVEPRRIAQLSRVCKLWDSILKERLWPIIFRSRFGYVPTGVNLRKEYIRISDFQSSFAFKSASVQQIAMNTTADPAAIALMGDVLAICCDINTVHIVHLPTSTIQIVQTDMPCVNSICAVPAEQAFVCGGRCGCVCVLQNMAAAACADGDATHAFMEWEVVTDAEMHSQTSTVVAVRHRLCCVFVCLSIMLCCMCYFLSNLVLCLLFVLCVSY